MPVSWKTLPLRLKFVRRSFDKKVKAILKARGEQKGIIPPEPPHYDFRTPEYASFPDVQKRKWEATRGMSHSFGFNRRDTEADYLSVAEIVRDFVDAVSKNGNLLLNVGPRGEDAQIPSEQVERLEGFGAWLKVNGEAIYGTRPHTRAEGKTADDLPVRFTRKGDTLYAIVLGAPKSGELTLLDLAPADGARIALLGHSEVSWRRNGDGVTLSLPQALSASPALSFSITPVPA
jgi:alpha-L-fucosidase